MTYVGVDGCRAGWFSVAIDADGASSFALFTQFADLWNRWRAATILVDIPIGLRSGGAEQSCDIAARILLGRRRSSVFRSPCRGAIGATSHAQASERNRRASGRGLSLQTYHILRKIEEVDSLLQSDRLARKVVREVHPEILFWALNGAIPMDQAKKRLAGFRERVAVLQRHFPCSEEIIAEVGREYRRYEVARDDIVDALAAAVSGWRANGVYSIIPKDVETDQDGLRMEMVYWQDV